MKIVFIGQKGIPSKSGGVEKHVEDLSVRLAAAGNEVVVYTRPHYTPADLKSYRGVRLVSIPTIPSKHLDAIVHTFLCILDAAWRQGHVDIIHFQSIGPSSLIWLIKLLRPNTPVAATFHTEDYYHQKWGTFAKWYLRLGERTLCRLADAVITVSEALSRNARRRYDCHTNYIPNGVQLPDHVGANELAPYGLTKGGYILAVSRLVRHKGLRYLIEAFKASQTEKKLVIVGGTAYTDDYVRELEELALGDDRIILVGQQSGRTLSAFFSNAYAFVQPSESEGLSIALLEAMSYGLPCLVSNIEENIEAVAETALHFSSKDSRDLAIQLKRLLDDPVLAKSLGRAAKHRASQRYNWHDITQETLHVYQALLSRQGFSKNRQMMAIRARSLSRAFTSWL